VESVFNLMESLVPEYAMFGTVRERTGGALPGISPSNTYPTADGAFVVIAGNSDPIFGRLMRTIGRADLANDPALSSNDGRVARNGELDAAITHWTSGQTIDAVLLALETAEVPAGRIYSASDIMGDPHYQAREMLLQTRLADGQAITLPGIVPKLSETPGEMRWTGPALGEHTVEILAALGYTNEVIEGLSKGEVIA
jgi:crotonobetainyl-CoA:carnitine CoA-transferase CaiB-like acyl-CoA transferase